MRRAELAALLELKLLPGVGDQRLWRLLTRHRSAHSALAAYLDSPRGALGLPPARRLESSYSGFGRPMSAHERAHMHARIARAMEAIEVERIRVLVPYDRAYPRRLSELHLPPPVLFARGDTALLRDPAVAVVGSRSKSEYGASTTRLLAAGLARAGLVVISGLARGIDRIAHEAALEAGGRTIAVLGCGVDVQYPPEHGALQELIARDGLLISEFLPGEPPLAHNFPKRNRIIAALALGVLIVEAGRSSGALITARDALDLGRHVFAVPGPIGRETSMGANELIRDGAFLVTCVADVLDVVSGVGNATVDGPRIPKAAGAAAAAGAASAAGGAGVGMHAVVWSALSAEEAHVDEVATRSGVTPKQALVALLELELDGRVRQLAGMRFVKT
jgi:DNA processing protein